MKAKSFTRTVCVVNNSMVGLKYNRKVEWIMLNLLEWVWIDLSLGVLRGTALASINEFIISDDVHNCAQPELLQNHFHFHAFDVFFYLESLTMYIWMLSCVNSIPCWLKHKGRGDKWNLFSRVTRLQYPFIQKGLDAGTSPCVAGLSSSPLWPIPEFHPWAVPDRWRCKKATRDKSANQCGIFIPKVCITFFMNSK